MSDVKRIKAKEVSDSTQVKYAIDFIEEMSWLLDSKKNLKLREIPEILRSRLLLSNSVSNAAEKYVSPNPNIHYLIGVLPRLFQDIKIFQRNEDIAEFASEVLGLKIARIEKRSKYELIGLIVCETNLLDDQKLEDLVTSLSEIAGNQDKLNFIAKEKETSNFSWNETIRKIGGSDVSRD